MVYSLPQLIVWIIVGLTGGTPAGVIVKREAKGFGFFTNLGLGLAGAVIGGVLFHLLGLLPNLDKVSVSMRDVVAALVGSLLVLLLLWLWQRNKPAR
ncbi:MAG: GlsB/YeaQ/YmgE family stress response membrane protein [Rhodomicrobium sp.]